MRAALVALLLLSAGGAHAQTAAPKSNDRPASACPPATAQNAPTLGQKDDGRTLSDRLAQSRGVICPPAVDQEMRQPPPEGGAMKVIPPPGSPGGNPNVQPK